MRVFLSYSLDDLELAEHLTMELRRLGNEVLDATAIAPGADLFSSMESLVHTADAVIGLTGSERPNLFFELGLAAGAGKPIVIAAARTSQVPSNIRTFPLVAITDDPAADARRITRKVYEVATSLGEVPSSLSASTGRESRLSEAELDEHVAQLLRQRGFQVSSQPRSADRGYDFVAETDKGTRILVEVKKWSSQQRIPVNLVQSLAAAVAQTGSDYGLLVSTTRFTAAAVELASKSSVILKSLEELSANVGVEEVLRATPSSILRVSLAPPTMPIVHCTVGSVVLPLYLDTGSPASFGDEAAFVSTGEISPGDVSDYAELSLTVGGRISPIEAREIDIPVSLTSAGGSVFAVLRILLVKDWWRTPLASMGAVGFVGRSFLLDNDLSLNLFDDEVTVKRGERPLT